MIDRWPEGVAIAATIFLLVRLASDALGRWIERRTRMRRLRIARAGEMAGERLLVEAGYAVLGRQVETEWTVRVDGDSHPVTLRADLLVARRGARYVAEVKTGEHAPRIESSATRRQLLEYRLAFDVDGVLLIDPGAERIREVVFPLEGAPPPSRSVLPLLLAALAGGAIALFLAT